jgi:hypothetical protein
VRFEIAADFIWGGLNTMLTFLILLLYVSLLLFLLTTLVVHLMFERR